jgi:hypothetical protein
MDIFSEDAFDNRREYICGFYHGEHGELYRDYPYLAPDHADRFVQRTATRILAELKAILAIWMEEK